MITTKSEKRLIEALRHSPKSRDASKLVEMYYDEIYIFAYKQVLNKETALDLTQEIFINVITNIGKYDSAKATFRVWLYKIAANRLIDHHRKTSSFVYPLDIEEVDPGSDTDICDELEKHELCEKIGELISGFPKDTQEILRLKLFSDMTFADIAQSLGMAESTVKSVYYRAVKNIKKELNDEY